MDRTAEGRRWRIVEMLSRDYPDMGRPDVERIVDFVLELAAGLCCTTCRERLDPR